MTIRAGRLRDRVTLHAPPDPEAVDSYGEQGPGPGAALGTYWAEVRPLSGREAEAARQLRAEASHAVTMRDVGVRITSRHALVWHTRYGDRTLEIAGEPHYLEKDAEWSIVGVETPDDG